jgi:predicted dehydrogenase
MPCRWLGMTMKASICTVGNLVGSRCHQSASISPAGLRCICPPSICPKYGQGTLVVSATTRHWSEAVRGETFTALTVQFEGGAVGTMVSSWHALAIPECRLRVDGTAGSLLSVKTEVVADECHVTVQRPGEAPSTQDASLPHAFTACMGESMRRLLEAMDTGTEPVHSGRDNLHTMAIVDGAYLSAAQDGAAVSLAHLPAP